MKPSANDRVATGKLIIQSRNPRKIGEILPQLKANDGIRLIIVEECTEAEYRRQHEVDIGQVENQYTPGWDYFYRVEAAD